MYQSDLEMGDILTWIQDSWLYIPQGSYTNTGHMGSKAFLQKFNPFDPYDLYFQKGIILLNTISAQKHQMQIITG